MKEQLIRLALQMAVPMLVKVTQDMLRSVDVTGLREKLLTQLMSLAQKTNTTIDDQLVQALVPVLVSPEHLSSFINETCPPLEAFIKNSETKWDDEICVPVLSSLKEVLLMPGK